MDSSSDSDRCRPTVHYPWTGGPRGRLGRRVREAQDRCKTLRNRNEHDEDAGLSSSTRGQCFDCRVDSSISARADRCFNTTNQKPAPGPSAVDRGCDRREAGSSAHSRISDCRLGPLRRAGQIRHAFFQEFQSLRLVPSHFTGEKGDADHYPGVGEALQGVLAPLSGVGFHGVCWACSGVNVMTGSCPDAIARKIISSQLRIALTRASTSRAACCCVTVRENGNL